MFDRARAPLSGSWIPSDNNAPPWKLRALLRVKPPFWGSARCPKNARSPPGLKKRVAPPHNLLMMNTWQRCAPSPPETNACKQFGTGTQILDSHWALDDTCSGISGILIAVCVGLVLGVLIGIGLLICLTFQRKRFVCFFNIVADWQISQVQIGIHGSRTLHFSAFLECQTSNMIRTHWTGRCLWSQETCSNLIAAPSPERDLQQGCLGSRWESGAPSIFLSHFVQWAELMFFFFVSQETEE